MKKISIHFLILITLIVSFLSCSSNDDKNSNNTVTPIINETLQTQNVAYGDDDQQLYDIYLPDIRNENTKVIVLIHGGGWTSGDKTSMDQIKDRLLIDFPDYAVVNMNYRLASLGVSPFPMQLNDITLMLNHLIANQVNYNISTNIAFIGNSAGAHLALLWSYNYDIENNVNMVASIVGPTNLADDAYNDNPQFQLPQILAYFGINATTEFLETYSPLHQVKATSPPTILFYGGNDGLIPTSQGIDLDAKLTELNVVHEFTLYPNEGHGWTGNSLFDTWTKLSAFLETHH